VDPDPQLIESPVERQIRQAMERGEFDDLPGAGKPIPGAGQPDEPLWWVKAWVERESLGLRDRESA
jgi:Domain of unknown function (DUF1992)